MRRQLKSWGNQHLNSATLWVWGHESYNPVAMAESFGVLNPEENAAAVFPSASLLPVPGVSSRDFATGFCRASTAGGCTSHSTDLERGRAWIHRLWVEVTVPVLGWGSTWHDIMDFCQHSWAFDLWGEKSVLRGSLLLQSGSQNEDM